MHTRLRGPFSGTTQVSWYQKGKTNLNLTEARDSEWQWHQLGRMQVCTLLQTDNHTSTPPLCFLQAGCPSCWPTNSVKALKATICCCTIMNKKYSIILAPLQRCLRITEQLQCTQLTSTTLSTEKQVINDWTMTIISYSSFIHISPTCQVTDMPTCRHELSTPSQLADFISQVANSEVNSSTTMVYLPNEWNKISTTKNSAIWLHCS